MGNENDLPKWVKNIETNLENIDYKILIVKKKGQAEAKRGLEKVAQANKLEVDSNYIRSVLNQPHESENWNDEIVSASGIRLENRIKELDSDLDNIIAEGNQVEKNDKDYHSYYFGVVPSTDTTAGTAVFLSANIEKRFTQLEPSYLPTQSNPKPEVLSNRETLFIELGKNICRYGNEFVSMLDGSEKTINIDSSDTFAQAAHSMRDCFQKLIEQLAPTSVVSIQPWFEKTDGAPTGVSRRSRLRYMLYGSGENFDEKAITRLDEQSDIAKDSLDLIIARAHDHDLSLSKDEVILAIDQARFSLLNILKLYDNYRKKRPVL
ncbi:hypothetical protein KJ742_01920 [Patescibacteria group bacterium]|nr:hypothetical protein [Patescibacteria group bacterium]